MQKNALWGFGDLRIRDLDIRERAVGGADYQVGGAGGGSVQADRRAPCRQNLGRVGIVRGAAFFSRWQLNATA